VSGVRQYYEAPGVPMVVPGRPGDVASAWIAHRERLRGWLENLAAEEWNQQTRCNEWLVSDLVRHLISGSQFLGYTLHESKKGIATRLLDGFEPQVTPGAAASQFSQLSAPNLLHALEEVDARVHRELDRCTDGDWLLAAEAPLGRVPAFVSVNHFLFDSWVHERDLMLPAGEVPPTVLSEVSVVAPYVIALAGCAGAVANESGRSQLTLDVRMTDPELRLFVEAGEPTTTVTFGDAPAGTLTVTGAATDLIDFATGRPTGDRLQGDPAVFAFLRHLAEGLA
jgi:uncharacterized protein (TIGR03083 family)